MPPPSAPEFPAAALWLNTPTPLRFAHELRGQLVLLLFWSYTNVHCLHALAELQQLQKKYAGRPVVTIAIHAGKYPTSPAAVAAAVQRLDIRCPVIVDLHHEIWNQYAISTWPTFILIGPDAQIIGALSGEGQSKILESSINRALAKSQTQPSDPRPVTTNQTPSPVPITNYQLPITNSLLFPTKILVDPANNRLFLLDTGHHRVLVTSLPDENANLAVEHIIGCGAPGRADGDFHTASFHRPQGFIANPAGDVLYLADTANHLVRRIDLKSNRVHTILGTGEPRFDHEAGKSGRDQPLSSPWDLALLGNRLYIAQAGQHQIFAMNLMTAMTEVAAGTAREGFHDGPALQAHLAQPSALALDPQKQILYFTDAQSSALRALDLQSKTVTTLLGKSIFDFGDIDGPLDAALLQHPLALALSPDRNALFLADTLNHKIKIIDLNQRTIQSLTIPNLPLAEPMGLAPLSPTQTTPQTLLLSDTNHHRLLQLNLTTGAWHPINIRF